MNRRRQDQSYREGRLPASAPLANPYVPFQAEDSPKYHARKGLIRGTLYPGLDLPFMGMVNQSEKTVSLLSELQALGFAVQELALYLDTHQNDKETLELYRDYQKKYMKIAEEYQKRFGPLNHKMLSEKECYTWLDDPWPWEFCQNKEG